MKKAFTYSALVLLLAATACNKTESVSLGEGGIRFAPASVETRALIEDAAGLQAQTFQVYDLLDGASYIDDVIAYADGAWNYASENTYSWKAGAHKFYGFTQNAGTLSANVLTVSKTLTTAEADQTDLLYSEVFSTTAADWKADAAHTVDTPVALHMKHLFSAVSITLKNCTDFEASVTKVTAPAIPNAGSATVSFADNAADVTYTTPTVSTSSSFVSATPISTATTLASQKSIDVLKMAAADAKAYQLVWPQALAEDAVTVTVSYTLNGKTYTDKTVALPADTWVAGKKYDYELQILPSDIRLVFVVQPWDSGEAGEIDTETGSINMSNVTWMNTKVKLTESATSTVNTVNNSSYSVNMYYKPWVSKTVDEVETWSQYDGYYPAQGYFTVNYPVSGLFKIELIPAYGETTVEPEFYDILIYDNTIANPEAPQDEQHPVGFRAIDPDGETITNNTVYFRVAAAAEQDGAQHKAQINILFKPDGSDEWISAYSEVRANYALVIPATN